MCRYSCTCRNQAYLTHYGVYFWWYFCFIKIYSFHSHLDIVRLPWKLYSIISTWNYRNIMSLSTEKHLINGNDKLITFHFIGNSQIPQECYGYENMYLCLTIYVKTSFFRFYLIYLSINDWMHYAWWMLSQSTDVLFI
jgi:hypothetical protein